MFRGIYLRDDSSTCRFNRIFNNKVKAVTDAELSYASSNQTVNRDNYEWETVTTWDPANLADGSGETKASITKLGADLGDLVLVGNPYDLTDTFAWAWVQAADTLNIRVHNGSGGAVDLGSGSWKTYLIPGECARDAQTWNPGSCAAGGIVANDFTIPGVAVGDICWATCSVDLQGLFACAMVTVADTVTVTLFNGTTGAIDLASSTWRIFVIPQAKANRLLTWDPANLADTTGETSSGVTVTGTVFGDYLGVGAGIDTTDLVFAPYVQASNTVEIRLQNETGGAVNLGSSSWRIIHLRKNLINDLFGNKGINP